MATTRRALLNAMARLGGAGAVAETLAVWNFLRPPPAMAAGLTLPADAGKGKTVLILGAGVSGLCAAYELERAGYDCIMLEPQRRAGGRSLTLRRGDTFKEMGDSPLQRCEFDEGLYLNCGPGRFAHWHVRVIDYCRKFGVPLEPYIFASRANLVHSSTLGNGRTVPIRQALYDLQGAVAELADKCISRPELNLDVSASELQALREMLITFGDLTKVERAGSAPTWSYQNQSGRSGYESLPGYGDDAGRPLSPLKLEELLRSNVWNNWIFRDAAPYWQTSLLQPAGGMDHFVRSFLRQPLRSNVGTVDGLIRYGVKASEIDIGSDKVSVLCEDFWQPAGVRSRLLHFDDPDADLQADEGQSAAAGDAGGRTFAGHRRRQGRLAGRAVLGAREQHLRRHLLDDRHYRPDLVPLLWLPECEGHADRRLYAWQAGNRVRPAAGRGTAADRHRTRRAAASRAIRQAR